MNRRQEQLQRMHSKQIFKNKRDERGQNMKNDNGRSGSGGKRGFVSDSLRDYDPLEGVRPRRFFSDDDDRNFATRDRTLWGQTSWDDPDSDTDPEGELAPDTEWGAKISHFGKGPKGYKRSDERIKEEVCEVLARNQRIDASDIEVSVDDSLVTLSGTVTSKEIRRAAEMAIENISGVEDVKNELRIKKAEQTTNLEPYSSNEAKHLKTPKVGTAREPSHLS